MVVTLYYQILKGSGYSSLVAVDSKGVLHYASLGSNPTSMLNLMAKDFLAVKGYKLSSMKPESKEIDSTVKKFLEIMEDPTLIDEINIPYKIIFGTELQRKVWQRLIEIPCGSITQYSSLAIEFSKPNGSRVIGNCVGSNRLALIVPCHRVVAKSGKITGYRYGTNIKQHILKAELKDKYNYLIK